jgi:membrane protein required for colicin V production
MNSIDIIICIPLIWGLYKGFTKGLIIEAATFVAFGLGIWAGIYFSDFVSKKIIQQFNWHSIYLPIISFAITFLGIIILVYFIAKLVQRLAEGMALGIFNKIGGAIFGVLKFAMILSVIIFMMDAIEKSYPLIKFKTKEESVLYKPLGKVAPMLIPAMREKLEKEPSEQNTLSNEK